MIIVYRSLTAIIINLGYCDQPTLGTQCHDAVCPNSNVAVVVTLRACVARHGTAWHRMTCVLQRIPRIPQKGLDLGHEVHAQARQDYDLACVRAQGSDLLRPCVGDPKGRVSEGFVSWSNKTSYSRLSKDDNI